MSTLLESFKQGNDIYVNLSGDGNSFVELSTALDITGLTVEELSSTDIEWYEIPDDDYLLIKESEYEAYLLSNLQ